MSKMWRNAFGIKPCHKGGGPPVTSPHPAGKGSRPRPYRPAAWAEGWTRIFGSKSKAGRSRKNEKRKRKEG